MGITVNLDSVKYITKKLRDQICTHLVDRQ
jgi:hypothetical protein